MRLTILQLILFVCTSFTLSSIVYSQEVDLDSKSVIERDPQSEGWSPPVWEQPKSMGYNEKTFATPPGLKTDVDFWIQIYTKYSTQQGVFHYTGDTEIILGEIDLSQVYANPKWGPIRKEKEAELIIKRQKRILAHRHKLDIKNVRLQMGLRDRMLEAIRLSGYYLPMMEAEFKKQKLPLELTRVVFVESSFNVHAGSKVGASGLWQIMPINGRKFKYITEGHDLRNHPIYATRLAAKIFKENYQILKSWPLAVTGYNHGVGSMMKIVKKYKSNDIEYLVENVNSKKSFGFASRSFYATFLAALHVEKNANLYFPEPIFREAEMKQKHFRLTKKLPYEKLLEQFQGDRKMLKQYNPHIFSKYLKPGKQIPSDVIVNLPATDSTRLAAAKEMDL